MNRDRLAHLLIVSNFIAAIGGGTVLRKGLNVLTLRYLHEGSLFAFMIGSALGFIFYAFIKNKKASSNKVESLFSVFASLCSIILLILFQTYEINGQLTYLIPSLAFFAILSLRFSFWYYARSIRVSLMIEQGQKMPAVELSYYIGLIVGLLGWNFLGDIGIVVALSIDIAFQFIAGLMDFHAYQIIGIMKKNIKKFNDEAHKKIADIKINYVWCWRLSIATAILVIASQSPIFVLTQYFSAEFNSYIIAAFYTGTAISAIFCKHTGIKVSWDTQKAIFHFCLLNKHKQISLVNICILSALVIIGCIFIACYSHIHLIYMELTHPLGLLFICSIIASGILLELFLICFVTQIGIEEQNFHVKKMIKIAYGMMVMGLAIGYFCMLFFNNLIISLPCIVIGCFLVVLLTVNKKT